MLDSLSPFANLFFRIHKVGIAGEVVSVEYSARLVPRDHHRDLLGDAIADHISYPSSPEIVERQSLVFPLAPARLAFRFRHYFVALLADELAAPGNNTCRPPSASEISDRLTVITSEDEILGTLPYGAGENQLVVVGLPEGGQPPQRHGRQAGRSPPSIPHPGCESTQ